MQNQIVLIFKYCYLIYIKKELNLKYIFLKITIMHKSNVFPQMTYSRNLSAFKKDIRKSLDRPVVHFILSSNFILCRRTFGIQKVTWSRMRSFLKKLWLQNQRAEFSISIYVEKEPLIKSYHPTTDFFSFVLLQFRAHRSNRFREMIEMRKINAWTIVRRCIVVVVIFCERSRIPKKLN